VLIGMRACGGEVRLWVERLDKLQMPQQE
jgi:hypothetical protein